MEEPMEKGDLKDDDNNTTEAGQEAAAISTTTEAEDPPDLVTDESARLEDSVTAQDSKQNVLFESDNNPPISTGQGQDPMMSNRSMSAVDDDGSVDDILLPLPSVPGPLREEPTLKEKLVDRERQRRKEAERGRLKRQFALMSNGGGLVYDGAASTDGAASATGPLRENGSITGTVGGESSVAAHADLDDSMSNRMSPHHHHHHHGDHHHGQGGEDQSSPQQLGYTMERFLQERDSSTTTTTITITNNAAATNLSTREQTNELSQAESAAIATVMTSMILEEEEPDKGVVMERFLKEPVNSAVSQQAEQAAADATAENVSTTPIREETIEADPQTSGAPDKGVVMERFLKDPVVVDANPPPSTSQDEGPSHSRPEDVHRSVSFDIELQTVPQSNLSNDPTMSVRNMSLDGSNASVQVEVAPEDNMLEPPSPGGGLSVPSEVAPSSIATDDQHHRRVDTETSLGSVGRVSMDRQSSGGHSQHGNNDDDEGDEPRVFRLTEAEIQEMAAIEEASIGNAPPSDRDAESLVGELVGTFGGPNVGEVDPAGTTFSQGTPTTAMESGSILSGNAQRTTVLPGDDPHGQHHEGQHHHHHRQESMDDLDHNSIDEMAMSAGSVSSHLVVSPGASVSGSVVSVTANPPSEIIGRIEPTQTLLLDEVEVSPHEDNGDGNRNRESGADPTTPQDQMGTFHGQHTSATMEGGLQSENRENIVNRRIRPGMINLTHYPAASQTESLQMSPMPNNRAFPDELADTPNNTRTVDEFDFDKNDLPMTPHSLLSDSIQDLPGDELWTSPTNARAVSPINRSHNDSLLVPTMAERTKGSAPKLKQAPPTSQSPGQAGTGTNASGLERALLDLRVNHSSMVQTKQSELYSRGSTVWKALQCRLLPLLLVFAIETPMILMIGRSDRLCRILGRYHHQLLIAFIPIMTAISGNLGLQSSQLTTNAILHGHVTATTMRQWVQTECTVALYLGAAMGLVVAIAALYYSEDQRTGTNVVFALVMGISQTISAASAGCSGSICPVLLSWLLKHRVRGMDNGLLERAVQDVVTVLLSTAISCCAFAAFITPMKSSPDGCLA